MSEKSDTEKAIERRQSLEKLTLEEIADFMAFLPEGSKTLLPFTAELTRRVTVAQLASADAARISAEAARVSADATKRNADYVLKTLILVGITSVVTTWISWLNYIKP